ncbi:hypothetical protein Z043_113950 [Scleropages formosus]|uniref:Uncharacterized protein n=1 Tax=Scleropages formosus TaxID=113540 RepID=A0A0P7V450_SCLFO|nr:hypothetical protein Z043_113950 [Scleropages formosus]
MRKAFKDTSQYVVGELAALESEQKQIDTRASRVEKRLRYLMDTGATCRLLSASRSVLCEFSTCGKKALCSVNGININGNCQRSQQPPSLGSCDKHILVGKPCPAVVASLSLWNPVLSHAEMPYMSGLC